MARNSSLLRLGGALVLALVLLVTMAQSAFAGLSWDDSEDLATMAQVAVDSTSDTPAGKLQSNADTWAPDKAAAAVSSQDLGDDVDGHFVPVSSDSPALRKNNPNKQ